MSTPALLDVRYRVVRADGTPHSLNTHTRERAEVLRRVWDRIVPNVGPHRVEEA